ncbi:hypothetical protein CP973_03680 [Streptomyces albofaciens JCM 4342]|uniref:hypothetical protein n=1 Tax=Streptomyces albofaciens TaxID=66866 RepID=UPI00123BA51F|nr:hypothetical protein [Streptomyces albofaciens]KAA6221196.1 hypothetical protein CP973_03680 [Streptomyces albofaciens JCM 4342]
MSAHQPVTAGVRSGATEPSPTMNELLAACAAASAVSTPPEPPSRAEEDAETDGTRVVGVQETQRAGRRDAA